MCAACSRFLPLLRIPSSNDPVELPSISLPCHTIPNPWDMQYLPWHSLHLSSGCLCSQARHHPHFRHLTARPHRRPVVVSKDRFLFIRSTPNSVVCNLSKCFNSSECISYACLTEQGILQLMDFPRLYASSNAFVPLISPISLTPLARTMPASSK